LKARGFMSSPTNSSFSLRMRSRHKIVNSTPYAYVTQSVMSDNWHCTA